MKHKNVTPFKQLFLILGLSIFLGACGVEDAREESKQATSSVEVSTSQGSTNESSAAINEESASTASEANSTETQKLADLTVHYIDAGQADATLFEFADESEEYTILYDTGDWNSTDVVSYIEAEGVEELDLVIISHPDADHIGQLDKVIQQFEVGEVWMSGNTTTSDVFLRSLQAIQENGIGYYEPRTGDTFDIGPLEMKILHPTQLTGDTNADSISMLVSYGEIDFVFTGDAGKEQERTMLQTGMDIDAEILSLGHHGSDTSSDPAFIKAVSPEAAIYSAGAVNSYGHPSAEVISLVQQHGSQLYGTDVHGTILVTTNGEEYTIETSKEGTVAPRETESDAAAGKINLNQASLEELQQIVHIGRERAEEIISLRPFHTIEDLDRVSGIGTARLEDILEEGKAYVGG